jgi:hypothetical protein
LSAQIDPRQSGLASPSRERSSGRTGRARSPGTPGIEARWAIGAHEVDGPFVFEDEDAVLRAISSSRPAARAIGAGGAGEDRGLRVPAPHRLSSGDFRLENRFRSIVARYGAHRENTRRDPTGVRAPTGHRSPECQAPALTLGSVLEEVGGMQSVGALLGASSSSVEAARMLGAEVWRAERPHEAFSVSGLNSERAVRERLQKIAMDLEGLDYLPDVTAIQLIAIGWAKDDPLTILQKTERMLSTHRTGPVSSIDELLDPADKPTVFLTRLIVVQSIAGRLGKWSVRAPEIADARTARALFKDLGETNYAQYRALLTASDALIHTGRFRDAALSMLDADRLVRTAAGLLRAATALTRAGDYVGALWCVRACLLEANASFESQDAVLRAHRLEGRLRAIFEGRAVAPLAADESKLLLGEVKGTEPRTLVGGEPKPQPDPGRRTTLPPHPAHRALLAEERRRALDRETKESDDARLARAIARADPFCREAARTLAEAMRLFEEPSTLVAETFDVGAELDALAMTEHPTEIESVAVVSAADSSKSEEVTHQLGAHDVMSERVRQGHER